MRDNHPLGAYMCIVEGVSVSADPSGDSTLQNIVDMGTYLNVVQIRRETPQSERVKGRLAKGGWISLTNTSNAPLTQCNGHWSRTPGYWAMPMPLGVYKILISIDTKAVTEGAERSTPRSKAASGVELEEGRYLEVVETKYLDQEERVRGRLIGGGWVTLVNTCIDQYWASPMPTGSYQTMAQ